MKLHPPELPADEQINRDVLMPLFTISWRWWVMLTLAALGFLLGLAAWCYMMSTGMWVTGIHRPVMWGVLIANYVFWVGLSNSGTLFSAMLRLAGATWRRPITRAAEAMTVFALLMAAQFPLIHLGRTWFFYYMIPYANQRGLWWNYASPLTWDLTAIMSYLTGSLVYLYLPAVPDFAIVRDHCRGLRRKLYGILALGWRGTRQQWHSLNSCIVILAILLLPVAVSMHTIVSWDFGVSLTPGWHTSIFGPYFVVGAIYSGIALVITLLVVIRRVCKFEKYITPYHFDKLAKVLLVAALVWFYLWFADYITAWYGKLPEEKVIMDIKNAGPYFWLQLTMMLGNTIVAIPLLCFRKFRTNLWALFALTIFINIAMWIERFLIVVPSLVQKGPSYSWSIYQATWVEWLLTLYPFAGFCMFYLLFAKLAPLIGIWEIREDKVAYTTKKLGVGEFSAIAQVE
ncbi:MAG: polysulfide reductase NrfD [Cyanobacteria bacterium NC_groundwater_1444_Ag_S-0.65um_54_12]|nr:polysulfide reductase NrfD [Cyanobacteria bacterium NC_groundwater_1444_Ag_S-0.65um_54_12]